MSSEVESLHIGHAQQHERQALVRISTWDRPVTIAASGQ